MTRPEGRSAGRIAVVGMGRSGTTLVTELLGASGVFLGEVNWAFEHEEARAVNDAFLEQRYSARPGLPYGRLPRSEIADFGEVWRERARSFAETMDERAGSAHWWAFKDPRTTVLNALWAPEIDVVIGVFRRPELVADSFLAHGWIDGRWPRWTVLRYWSRFNKSLVRIMDSPSIGARYLVEMSSDLTAQLDHVFLALGLSLTSEVAARFDSARQPDPVDAGISRLHQKLFRQLVERRSLPR